MWIKIWENNNTEKYVTINNLWEKCILYEILTKNSLENITAVMHLIQCYLDNPDPH